VLFRSWEVLSEFEGSEKLPNEPEDVRAVVLNLADKIYEVLLRSESAPDETDLFSLAVLAGQ